MDFVTSHFGKMNFFSTYLSSKLDPPSPMFWLEENLILSNVLVRGESNFDDKYVEVFNLCSTGQSFIFPKWLVTKSILSVFDIIDVNEEDQTVKLMFKIILYWQDYRMDVNRTKGDVTRYALCTLRCKCLRSLACL